MDATLPSIALLLKIPEAGELLGVKGRKAYDLFASLPLKATVIELPGLRGKRVRRDLLEKAIAAMSGEVTS